MKKVICFVLTVILCFSAFSFSISSISVSQGLTALRAQFLRDEGPEVNGYSIDYSFFSPVKTSLDTKKYPLVIFLAGATEGEYPGKELLANDFAVWTAQEYQLRFLGSGGAYILIARAPEEKLLCWDSKKLVSPLKAAIDDFILKHPNVDTERIIPIGWCLGAKGVLNIAVEYPSFFSAAVLMVMPYEITQSQARVLKDLPVWLIGCKKDSLARYSSYILPSWEQLKNETAKGKTKLFTTFDSAPSTTFFSNHNVWLQATYDMAYSGKGYGNSLTIDANGNEQPKDLSMIMWLSAHNLKLSKPILSPSENCSCDCHSSDIIKKIFWKVKMLIATLFSISSFEECECGQKHW